MVNEDEAPAQRTNAGFRAMGSRCECVISKVQGGLSTSPVSRASRSWKTASGSGRSEAS